MSEESVSQAPAVFSSKERAALVAKALADAARRARFSTKRRRGTASGMRARRGERLMRLLRIVSFIGVVVIPCLVATAYIGFIQTPQYEAEARFTVRGGMPPSLDSIGSVTGVPSILIIQDTQIIMNYFQSRAMVEALDKDVHLQSLFQGDNIDFFSRLARDEPVEQVLKYWKRHMNTAVQMPAGIVVLTIQAFSPQDAVKIADAALASSEQLVNKMNDQMKNDALFLAETERKRAMANVIQTRAALEKTRNDEGILSADATATGLTTLMEKVQAEVIKMQQEYDGQRRYVRADAPQLRQLQTRIDAAQREVEKIRVQMTSANDSTGTNKALSGSMTRLDYAKLENDIAEKIYAGSLVALERARLASEIKMMYINTFVRPVAPEEPRYPRKLRNISLTLLATLAIWGVVVFVLNLMRSSFT